MIHPPNKISDSSPLSNWLNRLRDFVADTAIQSVVGGELSYGASGASIRIPTAFTQSGGDVTYGGEYVTGAPYAAHTIVYERAAGPIWWLWISEVAISSEVPTYPEPSPCYWRMLANSGTPVDLDVCIDGVPDVIKVYTVPTTWP